MTLQESPAASWTKAEDDIIRANFPDGGWPACRLMDRTPREVVLRARQLNVAARFGAAPAKPARAVSKEQQLLAIMREDVRVLAGRAA